MVSKCANPPCSAPFRYLHEGKLFRIEHPFTKNSEGTISATDTAHRKPPVRIEFFWLCPDCSQNMTLTFDPSAGIVPQPVRRALRAAC
jgi:hypothetical protein